MRVRKSTSFLINIIMLLCACLGLVQVCGWAFIGIHFAHVSPISHARDREAETRERAREKIRIKFVHAAMQGIRIQRKRKREKAK
jgi:hypothetical protein